MLASLPAAIEARKAWTDGPHDSAFRLFHGFTEGDATLTLDVYGRTLVVHDRAEIAEGNRARVDAVVAAVREHLPWLRAAVWKARRARESDARNGRVVFGTEADVQGKVRENGVWYALSLTLNRDAGLYLDTRPLRAWARQNLAFKRVLNTFAYTGSLGVAARAAPAREVIQLDRNAAFLEVARRSYQLNGFAISRAHFVARDFFADTARLRREAGLFDCVLVDPPFYASTRAGTVDLEQSPERVIDKVRPLVADGGWLVAVNNALWVSGADWVRSLEAASGAYMTLEAILPVPDDARGFAVDASAAYPADPAPFNHPTKIAVLRVRRKDGRKASGL
ncbi:MAG: class I SAM-dependent methyltransferase [Deltaproteobacteria bacterium]